MSQTKEQRTATERLRALPGRFRVELDVEGWPMIPGRYGRIEFDSYAWTAYTDRWRIFRKLTALPGVSRHQTGDDEFRVLVRFEALDAVAKMLGAKRKRVLTSEQARRISGLPTVTSTNGGQNASLAQEVTA